MVTKQSETGQRALRTDLREELQEQMQLLAAYCGQFDQGVERFFKPMATCLRVLLHSSPNPKGNTRALLDQFRLRSGRWFDVAGPVSGRSLLASTPLVIAQMTTGTNARTTYLPKLSWFECSRPRRVAFSEWWTRPVAHSHEHGSVSRMQLVRECADRDGGAHVDTSFSEAYAAIRDGSFVGAKLIGPDGVIPSPGWHAAAIRAIAHECILSVHKYAPWAVVEPYTWADGQDQASTETFR